MTDEEIESVQMGIAQPTETVEQSARQDDTQTNQQDSRRTDAEYNWGETRRKLDMLERKTREQEDMINRLRQPQQPQEARPARESHGAFPRHVRGDGFRHDQEPDDRGRHRQGGEKPAGQSRIRNYRRFCKSPEP